MGLNMEKVETFIDIVKGNMQYGRKVYEDGRVIPFCQIIEHKPVVKKVAWDKYGEKWVEFSPFLKMAKDPVLRSNGFEDCDSAPHGYRVTYKLTYELIPA